MAMEKKALSSKLTMRFTQAGVKPETLTRSYGYLKADATAEKIKEVTDILAGLQTLPVKEILAVDTYEVTETTV